MKLCWNLLTNQEALWVKILRAKYKCGSEVMPCVIKKRNASHTWRSICKVWDNFVMGVGKKIGNGQSTKFWWDLWTPLEEPLISYVQCNDNQLNPHATVSEFVLPSGGWNVQEWCKFFPRWVIDKMRLVKPPSFQHPDLVCWRPSTDGSFTVRAAYNFVHKQQNLVNEPLWSRMWKWPVPEKIKIFLWQVIHERVPSNDLRAKRGISSSATCPFNCESVEDTLHILRDCKKAREVWELFINPCYMNCFFYGNLQVWLHWNAKHQPGGYKVRSWPWCKVFSFVCWLIWKNRCRGIFETSMSQPNSILYICIHHLSEEVVNGSYKHRIFPLEVRSEQKWTRPPVDYVRLDVDGSVNSQNHAACGGLIRNHSGTWLFGFQQELGFIPSTAAEIVAILTGLQVCIRRGYTKVKIFTDSLEAINLIWRDSSGTHPLEKELHDIRAMLLLRWDIDL